MYIYVPVYSLLKVTNILIICCSMHVALAKYLASYYRMKYLATIAT